MLGTGIPEDVCHAVNLGYRAWRRWTGSLSRSDPETLAVPSGERGEMLFRLC